MVSETESERMPRIFYGPIVELQDGLEECGVPQEVIDDALDRIEKTISRALRHAGEAEDQEGDAPENDASEVDQ